MKKLINILLVLALVLSLCACKQKPVDDSALPDIAPAEQGEDATIQTDETSDNAISDDELTKTIPANKNDKTETSTVTETENASDVATVAVAEPSFTETYLPVLEGYAKRVTENGKSKFHTDLDSFIIKFDITKEVVDEVMTLQKNSIKYQPERESFHAKLTPEIIEKDLPEGAVIVRGSFAAEYGTSICLYKNVGPVKGIANFDISRCFTLGSFKIVKVYTNTDKIAPGDTIELGRWGTICQMPAGGYAPQYELFENFADKTEQKRTFVLAFYYDKELGYNRVVTLFQNAYEQVKDNTGDDEQQLAYDILQKYN